MATRIRTLVLLILWHFGGKSDALECGYNITSSQGWIESPGYPNVYPNDIDCFYVISQPVGLRIFLNFTDFRLQGGLDCEHDYIEIRDGGSEDSPILNTQVCGSVTPSPYKTTQHIMRIRFKTDSSVNYKGFRAFYKSGAFPNEFVLVTRETDILRVDMETLSFRTIPISAQRLMAIDYDPVTDRMYWTDADSKEIRSAFLNGTNDTLVHRLDSDSRPTGLALDDISRLIFYSDAGSSFIALMTMADFKHKNLIDTNLDQPMAIVLDKVHGFLFWTDLGSQPKIERALYDGSKRKILINTLLIFPTALALDTEAYDTPISRILENGNFGHIRRWRQKDFQFWQRSHRTVAGQRLFWMDAKMSKIESSDVNGGDRRRISQSFSPHFIGLVFYQSYLYITDRGQGHSDSGSFIHRLHVNNSTPEMLLNTDGRLMDIHIYSQNALRKGSRSCGLSNGGCSDICIPLPDNGTRCLCPDGYILDDLQKHCRQDYDACQENNGGCSHFCIQLANKRHKCWCPEGLFLSVDDKICSKDCVRNYTQLEGTLTSPGFPGNYPSDAMCIYTIEVPISYRITLIFLDFWLEEDNFCIYDKVEVHDGASLTSPLLTRLFCGNSIPDTQRSTKNVMTIVFKTDRTNSFKGFRATYTASIVPKDILLIGGSRRLTRMDIETQSYIFVPLGQTRNTFSSIEYDPQEDRLYWTSGVQLQSAFLNGTDFKVVRSFGGDVKGMALDPTARKLFYTAIYNTMIGIMSLSTLTNEVLITTNLQNPLAIALHTRKKFIFWSNVYKTANIERANYDGSNRITIFISSSASPSALAVDYTKNRLYWVDSSTGEVQCSTLDGINRTLVYKSQHNNIHLLALCGNYIYIIGWYTANGRRSTQGELYRFNSIDNTTHSFKLALENIFSMHIYSEDICIKDHEVTLSNLNLTSVKYSTPSPFLDSSSRFTKGILPSLTHSSNMDKIAFETTTSVSATAPILTVSSAINKTTATTGHTTFDPDVSDKIILTSGHTTFDPDVSDKVILTSGHTTFDPDVSDKVILTSGHTTFDPDASNNVTLTCNSSDLKVMEGFSWTASGEGQQRRETCTAFPSPHFVGLTYISCNVSHVDRELRIHAFKLDLLQSAIASVTWIGSTSIAFHSVNTLDITCVIKAGIFADEFVDFSCLCEVLSVVTISTTSTSDNWTTCTCKSVTSTTEWYSSNTTPQRDNNQNVIELGKPVGVSISGAAIAGGAAIAVIIVIIIIAIKLIRKKRKRLTHTCVYYHKGPQLLLVQDDVTFSLLKDTFTEQEDTKDSTTGSLARSSDLLS